MKKEELRKSPVVFHDKEHRYDLDGQDLHGITPIIAWLFPNTYQGIPQSVLNKAAEYGSLIHSKCELYDSLGICEEAKAEIIRLHSQALAHVQTLDLAPEAVATLENYAKNLIGRTK